MKRIMGVLLSIPIDLPHQTGLFIINLLLKEDDYFACISIMQEYASMITVLCNDRTVCVEHYEVICNHTPTTPPPTTHHCRGSVAKCVHANLWPGPPPPPHSTLAHHHHPVSKLQVSVLPTSFIRGLDLSCPLHNLKLNQFWLVFQVNLI